MTITRSWDRLLPEIVEALKHRLADKQFFI
jgi:hypothetical protein